LMFRPGANELQLFPTNILRRRGARELQERAYEQAATALGDGLSWSPSR
jgi:hypothetical protein